MFFEYIDHFLLVTKLGLKIIAVCSAIALLYRLFTTQAVKLKNHRRIRICLYHLGKISWLNYIKKQSDIVLFLLNQIYSPPKDELLFSSSYFNKRSWSASFTIALFYLTFTVYTLLIVLTSNNNSFNKILYILAYIGGFVILVAIYKKYKFTFGQPTKNDYKNKIKLLIWYAFVTFICSLITNGVFLLILFFIIVPMWFVWKHGIYGLKLYLKSFLAFWLICLTSTYFLNLLKLKDFLELPFLIILCFSFFKLSEYLYEKFGINYKFSYRSLILCYIVLFLSSVIVSADSHLGDIIKGVTIFLSTLIGIYGIVLANSLCDLISSNISRWLFAKIQQKSDWLSIVLALFVDLIAAASIVILTCVFTFTLFYFLHFILMQTSEDIKNMYASTESIMVGVKVAMIFIPELISGNEISLNRKNGEFGLVYIFFYLSVLLPTLIHFSFLLLLALVKLLGQLTQKPIIYIHYLLIENTTNKKEDNSINYGEIRATAIISVLLFIVIYTLYFIYSLYLSHLNQAQ